MNTNETIDNHKYLSLRAVRKNVTVITIMIATMGQLFKDLFNFVYSIICELSNLQSSNIYPLFALINNASLNEHMMKNDEAKSAKKEL